MNQYYGPNGYPPMPSPNNGMATASFVIALVSLVCCMYPMGILALIFGAIALSKYPVSPFRNRWMAITGIVVGALALLLLIVGMITDVIPAFLEGFMEGFNESYYGY